MQEEQALKSEQALNQLLQTATFDLLTQKQQLSDQVVENQELN